MAENEPGLDPLPEDARLESLDERLRRAKADEASRTESKGVGTDQGYRLGNRVLAELLGGIVGGIVVGYTLDWLFGTLPWFLLGLMFLGIISAFRNIIRISSQPPK